jgi:hypothetical protein
MSSPGGIGADDLLPSLFRASIAEGRVVHETQLMRRHSDMDLA